MTPFTTDTASGAGSAGGSRRTLAQLRAMRLGREARRGSGYVPHDAGAVAGVLAAARAITETARRGGSPPDPRGLRGLARHLGVSAGTVSRWFAGESWPMPEKVRGLRAWILRPGSPPA